MKRWYIWYGILGLAGFADTMYLTFTHFRQHTLGCSILTGCDEVLTSEYAVFAGIPLALLGVLYYLTLVAGTLLWYQTRKTAIITALLVFNLVGAIVSMVLFWVQWALIGAFCQYCILSAVITMTMFGIILIAFYRRNALVA
jgi:uncharacterized membrane protein